MCGKAIVASQFSFIGLWQDWERIGCLASLLNPQLVGWIASCCVKGVFLFLKLSFVFRARFCVGKKIVTVRCKVVCIFGVY